MAYYRCPHCQQRLVTVDVSITRRAEQVFIVYQKGESIKLVFNNEHDFHPIGDLEIACPCCSADLTPQLLNAYMNEGEFVEPEEVS